MRSYIEHSYRIGALAARTPQSDDGLLRADCALRTQLAQIAVVINTEARKYDSIYQEYERIRKLLEERKLHSIEFTPLS